MQPFYDLHMFIDREAGTTAKQGDNALGSICLSICSPVSPSASTLTLTYDLDFGMYLALTLARLGL